MVARREYYTHWSARLWSPKVFLLLSFTISSMLYTSRVMAFVSSRQSRSARIRTAIRSDFDDIIDQVLSQDFVTNMTKPIHEQGWRKIDWQEIAKADSSSAKPSPVEITLIRDKIVHIKHDDQLRLDGSQISGNKARKMLSLNSMTEESFPNCIVSYGGPQSNAMVALAAITHFRNMNSKERKRFVYYTKKLPKFLRNQPSGNLFRAQALGMEMIELSNREYLDLFGGESGGSSEPPPLLSPPEPNAVWIPQGGASGMAVAGAIRLANEIQDYWKDKGNGKSLKVFIPGGTCSTAALVHYYLEKSTESIQVVVVPCVGDEAYAQRQMKSLYTQLGFDDTPLPSILSPSPFGEEEYFRFGEPDIAVLETFLEMRDRHGMHLDLLYGSPAWAIMLRHWRKKDIRDNEIMYVHSGGLEGINTQLLRYKYKGLVGSEDIQLPGKERGSSDT